MCLWLGSHRGGTGLLAGEGQDFRQGNGEAQAACEFFDDGFGEVLGGGLAEDAGNAAAPLLDEFELAEDAGDDRVADLEL